MGAQWRMEIYAQEEKKRSPRVAVTNFMNQLCSLFGFGVYIAIVAVGVGSLGKPDSALALKEYGRDSSVNTVLEQTLNETDASAKITEWLATLPPGRSILVLAPPNNMPAAITQDLISYLAWPRRVEVSSDPHKMRELLANASERYCAVGLCYMEPPPRARVSKQFGPALTFIATEAGGQ